MATTTIPWSDGSGDNIYLTYPSASGDQTVTVSSDANSGSARTQVVTFTSGVGNITQQLTVNQAAAAITPILYDRLVFDGTAHIQTDIFIPTDGSIKVTCGGETIKGAQGIVRADNGSGTAVVAVWMSNSTTSTTRKMVCRYNSTSTSTARNLNFSNTSYTLFMTPSKLGWGTSSYGITKGSSTPSTGLDIGGQANSQTFTGYMQPFRIYGSDAKNCTTSSAFNNFTPVYTLWPCTYNGEAGLWCVETSKFYGNTAGAGTLTVANSS